MGKKSKTPKVEEIDMPEAATPAPPPEVTAQAPKVAGADEGAIRRKQREANKRGASALRIDLNVAGSGAGNPGTAAPGSGGSGLSIPRG